MFTNKKVTQNEFRLLLVKGLISEFGAEIENNEDVPNAGDRSEEMHIAKNVDNSSRKLCHKCKLKSFSWCPRCELYLCSNSKNNCLTFPPCDQMRRMP